jgi:putative redox protein
MTIIKSSYLGSLRCEMVHELSGTSIISDAPLDNNGKGESFSPTDLVASALGSCMVTIMGIVAQREGKDLEGMTWTTQKIMQADPRKINEIVINFQWGQHGMDEKFLQKLKNAAKTCPVALSLDPTIKQTIVFEF